MQTLKPLPNILLAGLERYQKENTSKKYVPTREQKIQRLLNRYASARLTYRKLETWRKWVLERDAIIEEAKNLIGAININKDIKLVELWEHEVPLNEIEQIVAKEYHTWRNNPKRPWNSSDDEWDEYYCVKYCAYLAKKDLYIIYYDHS